MIPRPTWLAFTAAQGSAPFMRPRNGCAHAHTRSHTVVVGGFFPSPWAVTGLLCTGCGRVCEANREEGTAHRHITTAVIHLAGRLVHAAVSNPWLARDGNLARSVAWQQQGGQHTRRCRKLRRSRWDITAWRARTHGILGGHEEWHAQSLDTQQFDTASTVPDSRQS